MDNNLNKKSAEEVTLKETSSKSFLEKLSLFTDTLSSPAPTFADLKENLNQVQENIHSVKVDFCGYTLTLDQLKNWREHLLKNENFYFPEYIKQTLPFLSFQLCQKLYKYAQEKNLSLCEVFDPDLFFLVGKPTPYNKKEKKLVRFNLTDKADLKLINLLDSFGAQIDFTAVSQEVKNQITELESTIYDCSENVSFPNLKIIKGSLCAYKSNFINLPQLEILEGDAKLIHSKNIFVPNLEKIGGSFVGNYLENFTAENLTFIGGNLNLKLAREIKLNALKGFSKDILFQKVKIFEAERLITIKGSAHILKVKNLNLPKLKEVEGDFDIGEAKTANLPLLQRVLWDFTADNLESLYLPNLEFTRSLQINSTRVAWLPALNEVKTIKAPRAEDFYAPNLSLVESEIVLKKDINYLKLPDCSKEKVIYEEII